MKLETLMADILISARQNGKVQANSIADRQKAKEFAIAYEAALLQIQSDLGMAFKRMKPEAKSMELMDGPVMLPIVKYQGELWYVDFRLKEKRNFYTALPDRFDSGGIDEEYYREKIEKGQKIGIIDCDGGNPEEW